MSGDATRVVGRKRPVPQQAMFPQAKMQKCPDSLRERYQGLHLYDRIKAFESHLSGEPRLSYTTRSGHSGEVPIFGGLLIDHHGSNTAETFVKLARDESLTSMSRRGTQGVFVTFKEPPQVNITDHHKNLNDIYCNKPGETDFLIRTAATLVLCSGDSLVKWTSMEHKFKQDPSFSMLIVDSRKELEAIRYSDVVKASIVVVSHEAFLSKYYKQNATKKDARINTAAQVHYPSEFSVMSLPQELRPYVSAPIADNTHTFTMPQRGSLWEPILEHFKAPILESFRWERLLVDDAHKVFETSKGKKRRCKFFSLRLESHSRWYLSSDPFAYGDISSCGILHFLSRGDIPYGFAEFFSGKKLISGKSTIEDSLAEILARCIKSTLMMTALDCEMGNISLTADTRDNDMDLSPSDTLTPYKTPQIGVILVDFATHIERIIYGTMAESGASRRELLEFCIHPENAANTWFGGNCVTVCDAYQGFIQSVDEKLRIAKAPHDVFLTWKQNLEDFRLQMHNFFETVEKCLEENLYKRGTHDPSGAWYYMSPKTPYACLPAREGTPTCIRSLMEGVTIHISTEFTEVLLQNLSREDLVRIANEEAHLMCYSSRDRTLISPPDILREVLLRDLIGNRVKEAFLKARLEFKQFVLISQEYTHDSKDIMDAKEVEEVRQFLLRHTQYLDDRSIAYMLLYYDELEDLIGSYIERGLDKYSSLVSYRAYISNLLVTASQPSRRSDEEGEDTDNSCVICQETFSGIVQVLDCGHKFCHTCIVHWFSKSGACPTCRKEFSSKYITCFTGSGDGTLETASLPPLKQCTKAFELEKLLLTEIPRVPALQNGQEPTYPTKTILVTSSDHRISAWTCRLLHSLDVPGLRAYVYEKGQKTRNKILSAFEAPCTEKCCRNAIGGCIHQRVLVMGPNALSTKPSFGRVDRVIFVSNADSKVAERELLDLAVSGSKNHLKQVSVFKILIKDTIESLEYLESYQE